MAGIIIEVVNYSEQAESINLIRTQVFQIEQRVDPKLEFDGKDETAQQLLAYLDRQPVGTARIRILDRDLAKVERLAVLAPWRGQGIGKKLMEKAVEIAAQQGAKAVVIHAQAYIKDLYYRLGFEPIGEQFEEAGILHIKMKKPLS
jgi:predicted GNAT family N-acyltransferase